MSAPGKSLRSVVLAAASALSAAPHWLSDDRRPAHNPLRARREGVPGKSESMAFPFAMPIAVGRMHQVVLGVVAQIP